MRFDGVDWTGLENYTRDSSSGVAMPIRALAALISAVGAGATVRAGLTATQEGKGTTVWRAAWGTDQGLARLEASSDRPGWSGEDVDDPDAGLSVAFMPWSQVTCLQINSVQMLSSMRENDTWTPTARIIFSSGEPLTLPLFSKLSYNQIVPLEELLDFVRARTS